MAKTEVLNTFDMDALRRQRARTAATGGVNLVAAINQISPEIGNLKVGQTAKIPIEGGKDNLRKSVMSIVAKLNNLTPKGGDWEGRNFDVISDGEAFVYVQRGEDLKGKDIPVRNRRGGGRKPANSNASEGTAKAS